MQTPLHYSLHLWGCLLLAPFLSGPALTLPSNSATMSSLHRGHVRLSISQGSTHILWNSCLQWGGRCSEMKMSLVFPSTHKYALMALTAMYVHQQQQHKPPHSLPPSEPELVQQLHKSSVHLYVRTVIWTSRSTRHTHAAQTCMHTHSTHKHTHTYVPHTHK